MQKYLEMIKKAKSKDELKEISYLIMKDTSILGKKDDLLVSCCVWKQFQLTTPPATLGDCAKILKIPQKYINAIK